MYNTKHNIHVWLIFIKENLLPFVFLCFNLVNLEKRLNVLGIKHKRHTNFEYKMMHGSCLGMLGLNFFYTLTM